MVSAFDEVPLSLSLFIFLNSSHVYSFVLAYFETFLLGVFAKLQKVTFSSVMSVHMFFSLSNYREQHRSHWMDFH
jgi:hypothetical protein